jgi:polyhydroxyalkanoate synthase subunit PhaC
MPSQKSTARGADEIAAPLDMLLIRSATGFGTRMAPNMSWAHLATNLVTQPGTVAGRAGSLAHASLAAALDAAPAPGRPRRHRHQRADARPRHYELSP